MQYCHLTATVRVIVHACMVVIVILAELIAVAATVQCGAVVVLVLTIQEDPHCQVNTVLMMLAVPNLTSIHSQHDLRIV
jgi:hypothetical protein